MQSTVIAASFTDVAWAAFTALQALESAVSELDAAAVSLRLLVDDSEWRSEGISALNEMLTELERRTRVEREELDRQADRLRMTLA